jgi:peptide deformylase
VFGRQAGRVRRITLLGEPVLRTPCDPVTNFDAGLAALIDDMFATMAAVNGVGLAANQVGVGLRLFVYSCDDAQGKRRTGHVVNPTLREPDGPVGYDEADEGCLSVPGQYAKLARLGRAIVTGQDKRGRPIVIDGTGVLARCLRHEYDHLQGMVYVDRLPKRVRGAVLRDFTPPAGPYPPGSVEV